MNITHITKKNIYKLYTLTSIFCFVFSHAFSQLADTVRHGNDFSDYEREQMRYGVFGHLGMNFHYAKNFRGIPEASTCIDFDNRGYENGNGLGFALGGLFEIPFKDFRFMGRLNYYQLDGSMKTQANIGPVSVANSNDTVSAISEYSLDANFSIISADFTIGYNLTKQMMLRAGLDFGFMPIANYGQQEYLLQPSSGSFLNDDGTHTKVRNKSSGPMSQSQGRTAFILNWDYELPLSLDARLLLVPEFCANLALNNVRPDREWMVSQIRAGAAIKWLLPPPPIPPPPPPPPLPPVAVKLRLLGIESSGKEKENPEIKLEEFTNNQIHPLLNYVFFDENSSTLPSRYFAISKDSAMNFKEKSLFAENTLDVYHHLLNIVGRRLRENPNANVKLVGTNSNEGSETGNMNLSKARAEVVKKYLVDVCQIEPSRISVSSRNLPETPSNTSDYDGIQENRRVEIYSNVVEILDPVILSDTIRTIEPKTIRILPEITAPAGVRNLQAQINQGQILLKDFSDPNSLKGLDWQVMQDGKMELYSNYPVYATISLTDSLLRKVTDTVLLPVNKLTVKKKKENRIGDLIIDNYRLITFEFDRPELKPASMRIVDIIKRNIKPNSQVDITGYTDRVGEDIHNQELSVKRAEATAKALGVSTNKVVGAGETTTLYPNDLPEGRFYCRTVEIQVRTPVENN